MTRSYISWRKCNLSACLLLDRWSRGWCDVKIRYSVVDRRRHRLSVDLLYSQEKPLPQKPPYSIPFLTPCYSSLLSPYSLLFPSSYSSLILVSPYCLLFTPPNFLLILTPPYASLLTPPYSLLFLNACYSSLLLMKSVHWKISLNTHITYTHSCVEIFVLFLWGPHFFPKIFLHKKR